MWSIVSYGTCEEESFLMNSRDLTFKIMSTLHNNSIFTSTSEVLLILLLQRHERHFHLAILQEFLTFLWRIMWTFTSECARNLITNRFNLRSPMNNFCIWPPIAIVKKLWQWRCTKCSDGFIFYSLTLRRVTFIKIQKSFLSIHR